jgi:hypothetical protein
MITLLRNSRAFSSLDESYILRRRKGLGTHGRSNSFTMQRPLSIIFSHLVNSACHIYISSGLWNNLITVTVLGLPIIEKKFSIRVLLAGEPAQSAGSTVCFNGVTVS